MPRQLRFPFPGIPQHLIQRGVDRQACFFLEEDRNTYLHLLGEAASKTGCDIHAYVLMTNHVHLLVTPRCPHGISKMMQHLGGRYVQHINNRHQRTGTLWEGRYKATVVSSDEYLLRCYRYIELNPVRAGMHQYPGDYPWSSYRHNALGVVHPLITLHEVYQSLGASPQSRQHTYRTLVNDALAEDEVKQIREATQRSWPLGNHRFEAEVEAMLNRKLYRNSWGGDRRSKNRSIQRTFKGLSRGQIP